MIKNKFSSYIAISAVFFCVSFGSAMAADGEGKLKVRGDFYGNLYQYNTTSNEGGHNGFDLGFAHIGLNYAFDSTWAADMQLGAIRNIGSGGAFNLNLPSFQQLKLVGKGLWGEGSVLSMGQQINPYVYYVDLPMDVYWINYSMPLGNWEMPIYDTGVSARGTSGMIDYSLYLEDGSGTQINSGGEKSGIAAQGIVRVRPTDGLGLMLADQYTMGSAGTVAQERGHDNYAQLTATYFSPMIDFSFELGNFRHQDPSTVNGYLGSGYKGDGVPVASVIPFFNVTGPISATSYNLVANIKFQEGWSFYARYMGGNDDWQMYIPNYLYGSIKNPGGALSHKYDLMFGPTYTWAGGKLGLGAFYEIVPQANAVQAFNTANALPDPVTNQQFMIKAKAFF